MIPKITRTLAVIVSSTILATLAVNAVDMRGHFASTLLGSVLYTSQETTGVCPENMVLVTQALVPFCIDAYEASVNEECLYQTPINEGESELNLADTDCSPVSVAHSVPWANVTQTQAERACSRAGKRLPTAGEWYKASLGTPDYGEGWNEETCNVANNRADGVSETGSGMRCVSDAGVYDMIGNVWEWVGETIHNGEWQGRELPVSGYVTGVDVDGVAYATKSAQEDAFNSDRFWSDKTIHAGIMKGGYYNSAGYAGVYATYAASPPTFSGEAAGFRCAVTVVGQ